MVVVVVVVVCVCACVRACVRVCDSVCVCESVCLSVCDGGGSGAANTRMHQRVSRTEKAPPTDMRSTNSVEMSTCLKSHRNFSLRYLTTLRFHLKGEFIQRK